MNGYYVQNGICVAGNRYCDFDWSNCTPKCVLGLLADPLLK